MSGRAVRWAGVAGIVFVVLVVITIVVSGSPPMGDDAVSKIRDYYIDHRSSLLWANLVGVVGIPFILWFAVMLREQARRPSTHAPQSSHPASGIFRPRAPLSRDDKQRR